MKSQSFACRLCQQLGTPAKAHVIPNGFFDRALQRERRVLQMRLGEPGQDIPRQSAIWDRSLLCQRCERRLSVLDTYGIDVLRDDKCCQWRFDHDDGDSYLTLFGVDCLWLRGFLLFTLWRVLATSRPEFSSVKDPEVERDLRSTLVHDDITIYDNYPIILTRFDQRAGVRRGNGTEHEIDPREQILFPKGPTTIMDQWAFEIPLGDYVALIAVDQPLPQSVWGTCAIPAAGLIPVLLKPYYNSVHLKAILRHFGWPSPMSATQIVEQEGESTAKGCPDRQSQGD